MTLIKMHELVGTFAESKEQAKSLRQKRILPALKRGEEVELDFTGVAIGTQSFVHALIAEAVRQEEPSGLDLLMFSNCNESLRALIEVVVSYSQDDWSEDLDD